MLARWQREVPLGGLGDRVSPIFEKMATLGDARLEALRASGRFVVGEVNSRVPNAKTFHYLDGSHVSVIFSGLVDFYEAVTRILFRATNVYTGRGRVAESLGPEDTIAGLTELFTLWTPDGIARRIAEIARDGLAEDRSRLALSLSNSVLIFGLSHEFGHVLHYRPPRGRQAAAGLSRRLEYASDEVAVRRLVSEAEQNDRRMNLAGAVISLRVLAVFHELGHTFGGTHPLPGMRLRRIWETLRRSYASERDYWSVTPIAISYDEQLDTAGVRAAKQGERPRPTVQRSFSRLSAVLEEIAVRRQPRSALQQVMRLDFSEATREQIKQVAAIAGRMFPAEPARTGDAYQDELWMVKGNLLRLLYDQFPDRVREAFAEVL